MQFLIRDVEQDILCLTVYDRDFFAPDGTTKHELTGFSAEISKFRPPVYLKKGANKMTGERDQLGFFLSHLLFSYFHSKLSKGWG
jgi:hypothetical protein